MLCYSIVFVGYYNRVGFALPIVSAHLQPDSSCHLRRRRIVRPSSGFPAHMTNVSATAGSLRGHINERRLRVTYVLGQLCLVTPARGVARGPRHFVSSLPSLARSLLSDPSPSPVPSRASAHNGSWIKKWKCPSSTPASVDTSATKSSAMGPSSGAPFASPPSAFSPPSASAAQLVESRPPLTAEQTTHYNDALQFRSLQQARIDKLVSEGYVLHPGSYPADAYSHAVPPARHPTVTGPYHRDFVPSFPPSASAQHDIQMDLIYFGHCG